MQTLKERLEHVMTEMRWSHADLVGISQQSSSVVSQWLGNGSKLIKTIGKLEAAENIERASGFAALWVAKGIGPMKVGPTKAPSDELARVRDLTIGDLLAAKRFRELAVQIAATHDDPPTRRVLTRFVAQIEQQITAQNGSDGRQANVAAVEHN